MPQVTPTGWLPIQNALVSQLTTWITAHGAFPTTVPVLPTVLEIDDVPHWDVNQDVLVKPGDERPHPDVIDGAGRFDNRRTRTVEVVARTHMYLDPSGQNATVMATPSAMVTFSNDHMALEDVLCDALETFIAEDNALNVLTLQCRMQNLRGPRKQYGDRKGGWTGWVQSIWTCDIEYERVMTLPPLNAGGGPLPL